MDKSVMQRAQSIPGYAMMAAQHDGGTGEELHKAWAKASFRGHYLQNRRQDITQALSDTIAAAHAFMDYAETKIGVPELMPEWMKSKEA